MAYSTFYGTPSGPGGGYRRPPAYAPGDYGGPATPRIPSTNTPPPADPAPSSSGGGSEGGSTPDYATLLASDPGYIQAMAAWRQLQAESSAKRQAALRALTVRYGFVPGDFKDQYGDIAQSIIDAARANTNSETARLDRNYQLGITQLKRGLAGRGMLQSGDLGYGLNLADVAKGEHAYDLGNQFADQANNVIGDYLTALQGGRANLTNAILAAEANVINNQANYPPTTSSTSPDQSTPQQQASYVPGSTLRYGAPVYQTATGMRYRQNGTPFGY